MNKNIRVAFDLTKGQESIILKEFKELQRILIQHSMSISLLLDEPLSYRKLELYDVIIIISPIAVKYKPHEIKALLQFSENGGGILVMSRAGGDSTLGTNLSALLKHYNLKIGEGKVLNLNPNSTDPSSVIGISSLAFPELTDHDQLIFYNSVSIIADAKNILFSSSSENNGELFPLAAFNTRGSGRLVLFGSASPFDDSPIGIGYLKNQQIFLKVIKWLSHTWDPIKGVELEELDSLSEQEDSLDNLIKNLVPEISEIVDKGNLVTDFEYPDFDVESTVIRILRSFLANALRDAHDSKVTNNIQIEGFDQLIMFLSRIARNLDELTKLMKGNNGS